MITPDNNPSSAEEQKKDPANISPDSAPENSIEPKAEDATGFTESYWNEKREKLSEKYPELKEEDLDYHPEQHAEFMDNLRIKLDKSPGEINNFLDSL